MYKMYQNLFIEAILPNLAPEVMDELRLYNRELRRVIERIPLKPATPMDVVWFDEHETGSRVMTCSKSDELVISHGFEDTNYMQHAREYTPKTLVITGEIPYRYLDIRWLISIKNIVIHDIPESYGEDIILLFLKKCKASGLTISNEKFELNAEEILKTMPYITKIDFGPTKFSPGAYELLMRKTRKGPGLNELSIKNTFQLAFDALQLVSLIEKADFLEDKENSIRLEYVTGKRDDFNQQLKKSLKVPNLIIEDEDYVINLQSSKLKITIANFVD